MSQDLSSLSMTETLMVVVITTLWVVGLLAAIKYLWAWL